MIRQEVVRFLGSVRCMMRRADAINRRREEVLIELRDPSVPALGVGGEGRTNVPGDPMRRYDRLIDQAAELAAELAQLRADIMARSVLVERVLRAVHMQADATKASIEYYANAKSLQDAAACCGCGARKLYYLLREAADFTAAAAEEDLALWDVIERALRKEEE